MKSKVLLVKIKNSSFVLIDEEILKSEYDLKSFQYGEQKGYRHAIRQLQLLFWLFRNFRQTRLIYLWFADYHGFLPAIFAKIFNIPSVVVIGGFDAANFPEYKYGAHVSAFRSWVVKFICHQSDLVFTPSYFMRSLILANISPKLENKIEVVYLCQDTKKFKPLPCLRERDVLYIAGVSDEKRYYIKGLDYFVRIVELMPEISFTIVGLSNHFVSKLSGFRLSNMRLLPWIDLSQMAKLYSSHKVVCLFSRFEAFGMSVLEGMLCECVPIVNDDIGPSEFVLTDFGWVIPKEKIEEAVFAIKEGIIDYPSKGPIARNFAADQFNIDRRHIALLSKINKLLNPK